MTTCLITGTNRGIGLELARSALARNWRVYGSARSEISDVSSRICEHPNFMELKFDVTDHAAIAAAARQIDEPIDVLINNAGIIGPEMQQQTTLNMDFAGFAQTLAVNTMAPLAISQAFLPHLKRAPNPKILTISSQMSSMGYRNSDRIAYRASKAAVNKVMQGLATDLEGDGICVALLNPGWVQTDMGGSEADFTPKEVAEGVLRVAEALTIEDTGHMYLWSGERTTFWAK